MGCQAAKAVQPTESVKRSKQNPQAENKLASVPRPPKLDPLTRNRVSQQYSKSARQLRVGKNLLAGMTCQNLGGVELIGTINQKIKAHPEKPLGSSLDAIPELYLPRPTLANHSIKNESKLSEPQQDGTSKSRSKKVNKGKLGLRGPALQQNSIGDEVLRSPKKKLVEEGLHTSVVTPSPSPLAESFQSKSKRFYPSDKVGMSPDWPSTARANRNFRVILQRASSAERKQRGPVKAVNIDNLLQDFDKEDQKSSAIQLGSKEQIRKHLRKQGVPLDSKQHKSTPKILRKRPKPQEKLGSCAAEFGEGNQASISDRMVLKGFKEDQCPKSGELADTSTAFPSCQARFTALADMSIVLKSVSSKSEEDSDGSPRMAKQSPQLQKARMDTDKSENSAVLEMSDDKPELLQDESQRPIKVKQIDTALLDRHEKNSVDLPLERRNFSLAAIEPGHFNCLKRKFGGRIVKFNSSSQEQNVGKGFKKFESARLIVSPRKAGNSASHRLSSQRHLQVSGQPRLTGFKAFHGFACQPGQKLPIQDCPHVEEKALDLEVDNNSKTVVSHDAIVTFQAKIGRDGAINHQQ